MPSTTTFSPGDVVLDAFLGEVRDFGAELDGNAVDFTVVDAEAALHEFVKGKAGLDCEGVVQDFRALDSGDGERAKRLRSAAKSDRIEASLRVPGGMGLDLPRGGRAIGSGVLDAHHLLHHDRFAQCRDDPFLAAVLRWAHAGRRARSGELLAECAPVGCQRRHHLIAQADERGRDLGPEQRPEDLFRQEEGEKLGRVDGQGPARRVLGKREAMTVGVRRRTEPRGLHLLEAAVDGAERALVADGFEQLLGGQAAPRRRKRRQDLEIANRLSAPTELAVIVPVAEALCSGFPIGGRKRTRARGWAPRRARLRRCSTVIRHEALRLHQPSRGLNGTDVQECPLRPAG